MFGTQPLSVPVLDCFQLDPWEEISVNFESKFCYFLLRISSAQWWLFCLGLDVLKHHTDVIMRAMASQIKHQSSVPLAFVRGIHWSPVDSPHKEPMTRKMFPFDDVIMTQTSKAYAFLVPETFFTHLFLAASAIFLFTAIWFTMLSFQSTTVVPNTDITRLVVIYLASLTLARSLRTVSTFWVNTFWK